MQTVYILLAQGLGDSESEFVNIGAYSTEKLATRADLLLQEQWIEDGLEIATRIEQFVLDA